MKKQISVFIYLRVYVYIFAFTLTCFFVLLLQTSFLLSCVSLQAFILGNFWQLR